MQVIRPFLNKYRTILFDMDGVITSENHYWTTAALTIYEMLKSDVHFGGEKVDVADMAQRAAEIRKLVTCGDKTISLLKNKGVNSNWDTAYVIVCIALILNERNNFERIYDYAETLGTDILAEYDALAERVSNSINRPIEWCSRSGGLWKDIVELFQKWYMGTGTRPAMIEHETPLIPLEKLHQIFSMLMGQNKILGYGTGRIKYELEYPLKRWDMYGYFFHNHGVTYDDVASAEKEMLETGREVTLTKPHPFVFLRGLYTRAVPTQKLLDGDYDKEALKSCLIVGDAGADILAAQAMGADFCAVLTGISGEGARKYFEDNNATYIINSIADFLEKL